MTKIDLTPIEEAARAMREAQAEIVRLRETVERLKRDLDTANYIIGLNIKHRATLAGEKP